MKAGGDEFFSFVYDFPEDPFANKTHAQIRSGGMRQAPAPIDSREDVIKVPLDAIIIDNK